ncbi:MAG: MATE family efflux transporter [Coriobacteriaceae bacterium]|nr:MATE family efflux transporter [Coriobacteriaceae bacterium]
MKPRDLTRGPIVGQVVRFAAPLLVTSVVQQLYSTVDLLFAGNVLGTNAIAAVGIGSLLLTCLVGLAIGISAGAQIVIAGLYGAKDRAAVRDAVRTLALFGMAAGVLLAVLGVAFAPTFVQLMDTPAPVVADARSYAAVCAWAAIPLVLYNCAAATARALGDSASPLIAQAVGGAGNILANAVCLCVLGLGVEGCAYATVLSNALAAAICIALLRRMALGSGARPASSFDPALLERMLALGVPIAVQTLAITLSNVVVQHQIDLLGAQAVAAFTAYFKIELPIYYAILAVGQAAMTFVAQNHGAGLHARCADGARACQALGVVLALAISAVMLAVGYWAFWLFDRDPAVIEMGMAIIWTTFPFYFLYAVLEVQGGVMRGFGHSAGPALVILLSLCVLRIVLVMALTAGGVTLFNVAVTYPITWGVAAAGMLCCRCALRRARSRTW